MVSITIADLSHSLKAVLRMIAYLRSRRRNIRISINTNKIAAGMTWLSRVTNFKDEWDASPLRL